MTLGWVKFSKMARLLRPNHHPPLQAVTGISQIDAALSKMHFAHPGARRMLRCFLDSDEPKPQLVQR